MRFFRLRQIARRMSSPYRESLERFLKSRGSSGGLEEWLSDAVSFMNDEEYSSFCEKIKESSKDVIRAWTLWASAGIFGAHRFYLRDRKGGFLFLFTLGFIGFGLLYDLIVYGQNLREYNVRVEADAALAILSERLTKEEIEAT